MQQWPEYTVANQEFIVFQTGNQLPVKQRMRDEYVHFWNVVLPAIKSSREQCPNKVKNNDDVNSAEKLNLSELMIIVACTCTWFNVMNIPTLVI